MTFYFLKRVDISHWKTFYSRFLKIDSTLKAFAYGLRIGCIGPGRIRIGLLEDRFKSKLKIDSQETANV